MASQRPSEVINGTQRHSKALRRTHRHSDAIRGNQRHSAALRGTQRHLRGHRDPRRPRGPRVPAPSLVAARARAPVWLRHRRAHLPVPFAADDPRSAPPSFSACPRRRVAARRPTGPPSTLPTPRSRPSSRAARCARFACNQRALRGHQRALRGHAEAIRGTQWSSEGSQRPVSGTQKGHPKRSEGTQRHSQAIRGHSEVILGHHSQSAALRRTQWQSRGRRDPRRPRWPPRVLSVRRVRVRVFAALEGGKGGGRQGKGR
jgi:hypothetical protein